MLNILQALLAFAVTMLGLSTVATVILEVLARLSRRRARVFNHMLGILFVEEIAPRLKADPHYGPRVVELEHGLKDAGKEARSLLTAFQDGIADSPLVLENDTSQLGKLSALFRWLGTDRETDMTADHFVRRLARTPFGRDLYASSQARIDAVIEQITLRYDELAEAASRYVKVSSSILCLLIGIAIAFIANVDGHRLLQFYIGNPEIAGKVAERANDRLAAYDEARERLTQAIAQLDAPAPAPTGGEAVEARETLADIRDSVTAVQQEVRSLVALGLPVGVDYFPYCRYREAAGTPRYESCLEPRYKEPEVSSLAVDYLTWFLSVFVTGMLIGLGGPFWYDAVKGLMRATQMLRGKDAAPPESKAEAAAAAARSPAEAFRTIVGGQPATAPAGTGGPLWLPATWTEAAPATAPSTPKERT